MGTFPVASPEAFLGLGLGDSLEMLRDSQGDSLGGSLEGSLVLEAEEHSQEQLLQVFLSPLTTKHGFEAYM